jgi:hypothetical protein
MFFYKLPIFGYIYIKKMEKKSPHAQRLKKKEKEKKLMCRK